MTNRRTDSKFSNRIQFVVARRRTSGTTVRVFSVRILTERIGAFARRNTKTGRVIGRQKETVATEASRNALFRTSFRTRGAGVRTGRATRIVELIRSTWTLLAWNTGTSFVTLTNETRPTKTARHALQCTQIGSMCAIRLTCRSTFVVLFVDWTSNFYEDSTEKNAFSPSI